MAKENTFKIPAPPPKRKELSDTPVKLCNEISKLFRTHLRQANTTEGVMSQPGAHLVLSFLAIGDGTTQLELVKATHLKAPSVSVILKKMEEEGIVERKSDPNDLRAMRVYLTDYGRTIDKQCIENIRSLDKTATEGLADGEIEVLMSLLSKIRNNLIENGEASRTNEENI